MFNTYVINLDRDTNKWDLIHSRLQHHGIQPIRHRAIDGSAHNIFDRYKHKISTFANYFCPNIPKAIALSHLTLIEHIHRHDTNDFALILEDDAVPAVDNIHEHIAEVIKGVNDPMWDIIKLYYFFYTNKSNASYKHYSTTFSAGAYLISRKGLEILSKEKVYYHYDLQLNFANVRIYKSPQKIFKTYELETSSNRKNSSFQGVFKDIKMNFIDTPDDNGLDFWLGFKAIRICGIELSVLSLICLVVICVILYIRRQRLL